MTPFPQNQFLMEFLANEDGTPYSPYVTLYEITSNTNLKQLFQTHPHTLRICTLPGLKIQSWEILVSDQVLDELTNLGIFPDTNISVATLQIHSSWLMVYTTSDVKKEVSHRVLSKLLPDELTFKNQYHVHPGEDLHKISFFISGDHLVFRQLDRVIKRDLHHFLFTLWPTMPQKDLNGTSPAEMRISDPSGLQEYLKKLTRQLEEDSDVRYQLNRAELYKVITETAFDQFEDLYDRYVDRVISKMTKNCQQIIQSVIERDENRLADFLMPGCLARFEENSKFCCGIIENHNDQGVTYLQINHEPVEGDFPIACLNLDSSKRLLPILQAYYDARIAEVRLFAIPFIAPNDELKSSYYKVKKLLFFIINAFPNIYFRLSTARISVSEAPWTELSPTAQTDYDVNQGLLKISESDFLNAMLQPLKWYEPGIQPCFKENLDHYISRLTVFIIYLMAAISYQVRYKVSYPSEHFIEEIFNHFWEEKYTPAREMVRAYLNPFMENLDFNMQGTGSAIDLLSRRYNELKEKLYYAPASIEDLARDFLDQ